MFKKWENSVKSYLGVSNQPFKLKIHQKVGLLRSKILPKQLLINLKLIFKKSKINFFTVKLFKNDRLWMPKFSEKICFFWGQISTFRAENTIESGSYEAKNIAQTTFEQLENNFQKLQKCTFLTQKSSKWPPYRVENLHIKWFFGFNDWLFHLKIHQQGVFQHQKPCPNKF